MLKSLKMDEINILDNIRRNKISLVDKFLSNYKRIYLMDNSKNHRLDKTFNIHLQNDRIFRVTARYNRVKIMKKLLKYGNDISTSDYRPLMIASRRGFKDIMKILMPYASKENLQLAFNETLYSGNSIDIFHKCNVFDNIEIYYKQLLLSIKGENLYNINFIIQYFHHDITSIRSSLIESLKLENDRISHLLLSIGIDKFYRKDIELIYEIAIEYNICSVFDRLMYQCPTFKFYDFKNSGDDLFEILINKNQSHLIDKFINFLNYLKPNIDNNNFSNEIKNINYYLEKSLKLGKRKIFNKILSNCNITFINIVNIHQQFDNFEILLNDYIYWNIMSYILI